MERLERLERAERSPDTSSDLARLEAQQALASLLHPYIERLERSIAQAIEEAVEHVVERLDERLALRRTAHPERSWERSTLPRAIGASPRTPKAEILQRLQQLQAEGLSLQAIANRINEEGVPTLSRKGAWKNGTIPNLLKAKGGGVTVMLDQTQWPRGKQFTVLEVKPPPEGRPYVLQQVAVVPRGEHEPQFSLWWQARISGAAPLQEQDVVAVKGKNLSSVLVERLVQEVPDGLQYLLVVPPIEEEPDSVFNRMYFQVITILALNTGQQMLTWQYI